jgi:hypothetical protein
VSEKIYTQDQADKLVLEAKLDLAKEFIADLKKIISERPLFPDTAAPANPWANTFPGGTSIIGGTTILSGIYTSPVNIPTVWTTFLSGSSSLPTINNSNGGWMTQESIVGSTHQLSIDKELLKA